MMYQRLGAVLATLALSASAAHANDFTAQSADGAFWLSGGVGLMNIEANEHVFLGDNKASLLEWEADGVVLYTATAGAELGDWYIKGKVDVGLGGDSYMVDYDWVPGYFIDQSMDGWSDRSIHPGTRLDYYFAGTIDVGRDIYTDDTSNISVGGGFKYTDIRWDAFGGSYIYSEGGVRNLVGQLPDDLRGISYRQRIPTVFFGFDGSTSFDRLTLSGGVKGGMTLGINDRDDHWLTEARVFGEMDPAPVLMLNASVDYRLTEKASLYLAGDFENVYMKRGDMNSIDTSTGTATLYPQAAGASFRTMSIQMGLRARF